MNMKIVASVFAVILLLVLVAAQFLTGEDTNVDTSPTPGPTAVLKDVNVDGNEVVTGDDTSQPVSTMSDLIVEKHFETARNYVTNYFGYSYRDKSPNMFINRVKPYSSRGHHQSLVAAFHNDDPSISNAWDEVRRERTEVTVTVEEIVFDPWYDATDKESVVEVSFYTTVKNNAGTGGRGSSQVVVLKVVESGGKYLVADDLTTEY